MSTREVKLIKKLVLAEEALKKSIQYCKDSCASDDMTGYPMPCTCGAEEHNRGVRAALQLLSLDDL